MRHAYVCQVPVQMQIVQEWQEGAKFRFQAVSVSMMNDYEYA